MNTSCIYAWSGSAGLHALVGGLCLWWFSAAPEPLPLESAARVFFVGDSSSAPVSTQLPAPSAPRVKFLPAPTVNRAVETPVANFPQTPRSRKSSAEPPTSASPRISYKDFLRTHPLSSGGLTPSPVPRIAVPAVVPPARFEEANEGDSTDIRTTSFASDLIEHLQQACATAPGSEAGRMMTVEFKISPEGRLYAVRMVTGTGIAEFDAYVLNAMRESTVANIPKINADKVYRLGVRVAGESR